MSKPDFDFTVLANGDLELRVETEDGKDYLHDALSMTGDEATIINTICDRMGWLGNAQLCAVAPEHVGALTDAPILTTDVTFTDTSVYVHGDNPVWWFPNYAVENAMQTLLDTGKVTFRRAKDDAAT